MAKKVLVILSGCGVYDGAEIHEATFTLLALDQRGLKYQCAALNENQFHVINHLNGEEMDTPRNMMQEAARIARGDVKDLAKASMSEFDALVIPGGFGSAKNLSKWAFDGPKGMINIEVKRVITEALRFHKPVVAMCMSPVLLSLALTDSGVTPKITVGTVKEESPYEIGAISEGMESLGSDVEMVGVDGIVIDEEHKIITTPCYMMQAEISEVYNGVCKTIDALLPLL